ncbi:MAG TPA: hypothetical protein PKM53_11920, partial [Bacteroidia bacterium]|nr:hypothetical protein [Bacteroidia bacterium]
MRCRKKATTIISNRTIYSKILLKLNWQYFCINTYSISIPYGCLVSYSKLIGDYKLNLKIQELPIRYRERT